MEHIFHKGTGARTFIFLHGTGGNEHDLLALGDIMDPTANRLGIRGEVLENGMPRFFRRLAEGVFDEADLRARTASLYTFILEAAQRYDFDMEQAVVVGYSNGANIAASMLFHYSDAFAAAILHHPMVPLRNHVLPQQATRVFIAAGDNDPLCPKEEAIELASLLTAADAQVTIHWEHNGHQLTRSEVEAARDWL